MHSGKHAAYHPAQSRPDTRGRSAKRRRGYGWMAVVAVCVALMASGAVFGVRTLSARLAASTRSTLFGASISSSGALAQATREFGHMPVARVYYPGLPSANAWTTGLPAAAKATVVVSFKAQPDAILAGKDDAALAHFFDTAPTSRPVYYSYYHEPEDNIAAGQFTLSAYKAAWKHIVALADSSHHPNLRSTLILMSWDLSPLSGRHWKNYLPGGGIISTLGWDAYPAGTVHAANPQRVPPADFLSQAVAASRSAGLPFGIAEFGLATSVGRPAWLAEVASYIRRSGALFATYFDSSRWPSINLHDAASIAEWRRVVQGSGLGVPAPSPTTPKPRPSPSRPAPDILRVAALAVTPTTLAPGANSHTTITFALTKRANVTVCVLDGSGAVVRQLAVPDHAAGPVAIPFYGYNGHGSRLPAGSYTILAVASNAHGSATAEVKLDVAPSS
jgi:hypothetical protein